MPDATTLILALPAARLRATARHIAQTLQRDRDHGVTAPFGAILMLGITGLMAATALPALLQAADTTRELAREQAEANREAIACLEGDVAACPHEDVKVRCWTNATATGETTECISQPTQHPKEDPPER